MKVLKQKAWLADQLIKDYNITVLLTCIHVFTIVMCVDASLRGKYQGISHVNSWYNFYFCANSSDSIHEFYTT